MMRNPIAFGGRIVANMVRVPDFFLEVFGKRLGPAFLLFGLWGAFSLLRTPYPGPAILLAIWMLQPFVSLVFLPTHSVRQMSHLVLIISSIGFTSMTSGRASTAATSVPLAGSLLLASYGLLDAKLAFLVAGLVMAGALALISLTERSEDSRTVKEVRGAAMLLAAEVVEASWSSAPADFKTPSDLLKWMVSKNIQAAHVDERKIARPDLISIIEASLGEEFGIGFGTEAGALRLYLPRSSATD